MIRRIASLARSRPCAIASAAIAQRRSPSPNWPGSRRTSRPSPRPTSAVVATKGAAKARAYLIEEFRKLGLEPLFDGSFTQDVTGKGPEDVLGVNVGARIAGPTRPSPTSG